ncbi:MAG: phenylalanine--tRNA ligase subunit beta [Candidatus Marinimicrobia bacterium]|nr:phenylalanine--tRNA ligase subunit beta [Candidatus Neomarinimicrobiota bacterium]MBL7022770.1 phenylalanine--tRNA ligase subunit beta [Candidatus Neomarinimicrobiota bacterium]MBL7109709.1 phenylalanine--tRNA ligase subunit beta [Candidatus Neomarinimicrobiota bacterium]
MKISHNWIQDYIKTELSPEVLEKGLTDLGLECTLQKSSLSFTNVVLGKVLECESHPDSDHLSICNVDVGDESNYQIVCGAPNVEIDIFVPVAKVGATLSNGEFKIKKAKLRGVKSFGMICSGQELQVNDDVDGIMIIDTNEPLGTPIEQVLNFNQSIVYDLDLTPNKGDCFGHLGVAREIGILEEKEIAKRKINFKESSKSVNDFVSINVDATDGCPRYTARVITGVKIGPSPQWLVERLTEIGQKSINNVVDASNYVLMDTGHPMHTFDLEKIKSKQIKVRFAEKGEKFTLLDETEQKLEEHHLLICDGNNPLALAGVMGGLESGITDETTDILIESAYFTPTVIRKSAKTLDISTESSKRFERDTDIENIIPSMDYLTQLIVELAGGEVAKGIIDVYPKPKQQLEVDFSLEKCNKFLGISIDNDRLQQIFNSLEIQFEIKDSLYHCSIPTFRNDLEREVDLFEEVARIYGYNNLPVSNAFTGCYTSFIKDEHKTDSSIRSILSSTGYLEHYSNSLISVEQTLHFSDLLPVSVSNPLSSEMAYLRNSIIPGLLTAVSYNEKRQQKYFKLFEIGAIHYQADSEEKGSHEDFNLGIVWFGKSQTHWRKTNEQDYYNVKGELNHFFNKLDCPKLRFVKEELEKGFEFSITLYSGKLKLGVLGKLSKDILKNFEIKTPIWVFSGSIENIAQSIATKKSKYRSPILYPAIERDIALLVKKEFTSEQLSRTVKGSGGELLKNVTLFDYFEKEELGIDMKSLAFSLTFQSPEKTLTDNEIDKFVTKILDKLVKQYQVVQR